MTMDDRMNWTIMATMSSAHEKAMPKKCMKIHRITACDQKSRKTIFMNEKSIVSIATAPNHLKVMADDVNHLEVVVICAVLSITENAIHQLIAKDRCEKRIKVNDPMKKNMNQIRMQMRPFIGFHQPRLEACKEGREKVVALRHGMEKVMRCI